jgi:NAD(P)-dependent dehydrogenase (short-subunit alcohol dehydrogenase family)
MLGELGRRDMAIAVVTGTSSGIGLATAVALARAGHTVAATMRNLDGGAEIRAIAAKEKLPIHLAALNIDDDASVRQAFAAVAEFGPIDVLVNNAGVPGSGIVVEEAPLEKFRQVMETNFFGGLRCIKAVIPSMRERLQGTIVNVTSVAGRIAFAASAPYAASKWAFEALSESLAQEMRAFNVRVVIVEPGVIATSIFKKGAHTAPGSAYPHGKRLRALLATSLAKPTPPSVVGDLIRDIVDGESWQLRYPAGPGAAELLKGRANKTDEQVILEAAQSDDEYVARIKRELGLDLTL